MVPRSDRNDFLYFFHKYKKHSTTNVVLVKLDSLLNLHFQLVMSQLTTQKISMDTASKMLTITESDGKSYHCYTASDGRLLVKINQEDWDNKVNLFFKNGAGYAPGYSLEDIDIIRDFRYQIFLDNLESTRMNDIDCDGPVKIIDHTYKLDEVIDFTVKNTILNTTSDNYYARHIILRIMESIAADFYRYKFNIF